MEGRRVICKGPITGAPTGSKPKQLILYLFNDLLVLGKRINNEKTKFLGSELLLHLDWNPCVSSMIDLQASVMSMAWC
jgi:hypothetical protein